MKKTHSCFAIFGLSFGAFPLAFCQPAAGDTTSSVRPNSCERCSSGDSTQILIQPLRGSFFQKIRVTGGQLTIPFKIRPKAEHGTFRLTTDVTLGAYIGLTRRFSEKKEYFLTIPLTAGLTFININDDNTSPSLAANAESRGADVVPGISWSSGIIVQLDQYSLGLIFGKDYASEVGNQWLYHKKIWWSFGLGFSFLR